jgi:hypothetical protein
MLLPPFCGLLPYQVIGLEGRNLDVTDTLLTFLEHC